MDTTANSARRIGFLTASLTAASLFFAPVASADEPKADAPAEAAKDDGAKAKDAESAKGSASASDLHEEELKRHYFLGARFRDIVVPQFLLELFAKGGATGNLWLVGPELSMRKAGTEIDISLSYADYGFGPAMFKGNNEPDTAYEIVKSDLKLLYLTFDLLFDFPLDKAGMFDFLVGGGLGVGVVMGDLYRNQAYPSNGTLDPSNAAKWTACSAIGDGVAGYCDNGNGHYNKYSEPSWADGGQKPIVIPWISLPQVSLRIKPMKHLQTRIDAGFSVTGFFTGLSAGYGF